MDTQTNNIAAARRYMQALSDGVSGDALREFFTEDIIQEEYPNRLVTDGAKRDLDALIEGSLRGQKVMTSQTFDIRNLIASGDQVLLELTWTGTLAIPLGKLAAGDEMRAYFATVLEFRDGKVCAQRNYDCFEPSW